MISAYSKAKELLNQYNIKDALSHVVQCLYMSPSERDVNYWSEVRREINKHEEKL
jgi:hypothetical protein